MQTLSSMLEGSETMSDCMTAELRAFVELQQLMLMVSPLTVFSNMVSALFLGTAQRLAFHTSILLSQRCIPCIPATACDSQRIHPLQTLQTAHAMELLVMTSPYLPGQLKLEPLACTWLAPLAANLRVPLRMECPKVTFTLFHCCPPT